MNRPSTSSRTRRAILVLRFSLLAVFFVILFYWLQPFSARFESKTVRDWFGEWSETRRLRADVIDAFGAGAIPELLGQARADRRLSRAWYRLSGSESPKLESFFGIGSRHQLATDWLCVLHHRGHNVIPALLESGQTNMILISLTFHSLEELDRRAKNETDPRILWQIARAKAAVGTFGQGDINRLVYPPGQATNSGSVRGSARR